MVTRVRRFFPSTFVDILNRRSQPHGIPGFWHEPTTLLSIAYAVVVRRYTRSAYYP
jgi:hypothetical protein